jgi:hypothetical protein
VFTATERYGFGGQQKNSAPASENFPWLEQLAPAIGPHEAIYDALDDLIQRLKTDANLESKAQEFVLSKVGKTVDELVNYLEGERPHFYDGTKSTLCDWILLGGPLGAVCEFWSGAGVPVKELFRNPGLMATAWGGPGGHKPLYVFFRPAFIKLNAEGKNIGNEALIFHEALHGFTGLGDNDLLIRFNKPLPSCNISEYIEENVLAVASGLDPTVLFPPCGSKPQ